MRYGHAHIVEALLGGSLNVDATDAEGCTALITAALSGDADCTRLLVESERANFQLRCGGRTALGWAQARGHEAVAQLLRSALRSRFWPTLD